jgi:isocitrate dehydrogenase kinase/phosphatase
MNAEASRAAQPGTPPAGDYPNLISAAATRGEKVALTVDWILQSFNFFYTESRHVPKLAKLAFEQRDPATSLALSKRRLALYGEAIVDLGVRLRDAFPQVAKDPALWHEVEERFLERIKGRYEADIAFAFVNSVKRRIHQGEWEPVEYSFRKSRDPVVDYSGEIYLRYAGREAISVETIAEILDIPDFSTPYENRLRDAALVAERLQAYLEAKGESGIDAIDVINAGFYRNRGAYIVGRILMGQVTGRTTGKENTIPFIIALLNSDDGIYVDAVLLSEADAHNIFSSTLANFHVTNSYYHELSQFLHSIMPKRPLGLHYSTIGFNHVGKVAVMNELQEELSGSNDVLDTAVGFRGTVAIGFSSPSSAYNLKVIRDHPTANYKWGRFDGIESVMEKYGRVHEINRTGSMLDNIIYYNLKLDRSWFNPELLDELLADATESVSLRGDAVVLKYLIVQRRMTPLPVFLETATMAEAETAIVNLGYCIKNNAAANIFNKDLDARNYGVSRFAATPIVSTGKKNHRIGISKMA